MNFFEKINLIYVSHSRKKRSFVNDVLTLMSGTTFAQILTILAAPLLTRLYGPEEFGLWSLFLSMAGIVSIVICLRYDISIMLPESNEEASNLLILSLIIACILSFFTLPIIWLYKQWLLTILKTPQLDIYLWLIPLFAFVSGSFSILNYWNSRSNQFHRLSVARITSSVVSTGSQIGTGFAGFTTGGSLISASLLGQLSSTFILGRQTWISENYLFKKNVSWKKIITGLKKYRKFPLIDTWSTLLNVISWQMPSFFLAFYFSPAIVGFYSLGFQLLQLPMNFIGDSISQVFFQRASKAKLSGNLEQLVEDVFKVLVIVGMFPILIFTIIGSDLFVVIFGEIWAEAGVYAQILSLWAFMRFISAPLGTLYLVMEKQSFGLKFNIINFILRILSLVIGGYFGNARLALILLSISGVIVYGYLCLKIMYFAGVELSRVKKIINSNIILFIPAGSILIIFKLFKTNPLILIVLSFLFCIIYYIYVAKTETKMQSIFNLILEGRSESKT